MNSTNTYKLNVRYLKSEGKVLTDIESTEQHPPVTTSKTFSTYKRHKPSNKRYQKLPSEWTHNLLPSLSGELIFAFNLSSRPQTSNCRHNWQRNRGSFECSLTVELQTLKLLSKTAQILAWNVSHFLLLPQTLGARHGNEGRDTKASKTSSDLKLETRAKWWPNTATSGHGFLGTSPAPEVESTWRLWSRCHLPDPTKCCGLKGRGIFQGLGSVPKRDIAALRFSFIWIKWMCFIQLLLYPDDVSMHKKKIVDFFCCGCWSIYFLILIFLT